MSVPGDVNITECSLTSPRGFLDLTTMFAASRVYESIFVPNVLFEIDVLDTNDAIGNLKIIGDETITFSFVAPGQTGVSYTFGVDKITFVQEQGATKSKLYTIHGVGFETFYSKTNYIDKHYDNTISSMVQDIHSSFLNSSKSLQVEATSGTQVIDIPHYKPFKAIDLVRTRAVSAENPSSTYVYFENALGMYFKTVEGMLKQGAIKNFLHFDTSGSSVYVVTYNNIISYEVPQIASSTERIGLGGLSQRISTYNVRTRAYRIKDILMPAGPFNSSAFIGKYGKNAGKSSYIPIDTASRPQTQIPEMTPNQLGFVSNLAQNIIKLKVYGDGIVKAGDVVNVAIPEVQATTGAGLLDPMLSGNFLVTRMCRNIGPSYEHPRYTDSLECMNGTIGGD